MSSTNAPITTTINGEVTTIAAPPVNPPSTGLSQSDQIALGVGLGIGIPSLILAYLSWRVAARKQDETISEALVAALTLGLRQRERSASETAEESGQGKYGKTGRAAVA